METIEVSSGNIVEFGTGKKSTEAIIEAHGTPSRPNPTATNDRCLRPNRHRVSDPGAQPNFYLLVRWPGQPPSPQGAIFTCRHGVKIQMPSTSGEAPNLIKNPPNPSDSERES